MDGKCLGTIEYGKETKLKRRHAYQETNVNFSVFLFCPLSHSESIRYVLYNAHSI